MLFSRKKTEKNNLILDPTMQEYYIRAMRGDADAMFALANEYATGMRVVFDLEKAAEWYEKGAALGHADCAAALGDMCADCGTPEKLAEAFSWYSKAAANGHAHSAFSLSRAYRYGLGVAPDEGKADEWLHFAAEHGDSAAIQELENRAAAEKAAREAAEKAKPKCVLSIDFGANNYRTAIFKDGKVLTDGETTPTCISFSPDGEIFIGEEAVQRLAQYPNASYCSPVTLLSASKGVSIGIGFDFEKKVIDENTGEARMEKRGNLFPEEIVAILLRDAKIKAETRFGCRIEEAVLSVPVHMSYKCQRALVDAARIAGMKVLRCVPSPVAAAIRYFEKNEGEATVLVVDAGAECTDIAVILKDDLGTVEVSSYETLCEGGNQFDRKLAIHLLEGHPHGQAIRQFPVAAARLLDAVTRTRVALSTQTEMAFRVTRILPEVSFEATVTRETLEALLADYAKAFEQRLTKALLHAEGDGAVPTCVLFRGGLSKMPMLKACLRSVCGDLPLVTLEEDAGCDIACGLATLSAVGQGFLKNILLLDVTPKEYGILTAGNVFTPIIAKNNSTPVRETRTFGRVEDNQSAVDIELLERNGEGERHSTISNFHFPISPGKKGEPAIEIVFEVDSGGILTISFTDKKSGNSCSYRLTHGARSEAEFAYALATHAEIFGE